MKKEAVKEGIQEIIADFDVEKARKLILDLIEKEKKTEKKIVLKTRQTDSPESGKLADDKPKEKKTDKAAETVSPELEVAAEAAALENEEVKAARAKEPAEKEIEIAETEKLAILDLLENDNNPKQVSEAVRSGPESGAKGKEKKIKETGFIRRIESEEEAMIEKANEKAKKIRKEIEAKELKPETRLDKKEKIKAEEKPKTIKKTVETALKPKSDFGQKLRQLRSELARQKIDQIEQAELAREWAREEIEREQAKLEMARKGMEINERELFQITRKEEKDRKRKNGRKMNLPLFEVFLLGILLLSLFVPFVYLFFLFR